MGQITLRHYPDARPRRRRSPGRAHECCAPAWLNPGTKPGSSAVADPTSRRRKGDMARRDDQDQSPPPPSPRTTLKAHCTVTVYWVVSQFEITDRNKPFAFMEFQTETLRLLPALLPSRTSAEEGASAPSLRL